MGSPKRHRLFTVLTKWSFLIFIAGIITFNIVRPIDYGAHHVDEAWITIALAAVAAASSIYAGIKANQEKKKLAAKMEAAKLNKPEGLVNAENTLSALAAQGLPGKDLMEDALKEPLAQSLTNIRELGASPVTIAGMASEGMASVTDNIRQLLIEDAQAKMGNMIALANFQAGPSAQFDLQQQEFNINKELGAAYARMEGVAELYQGVANGAGTMASAIGNQEYLKYLKGMNQPFPMSAENPTGTPGISIPGGENVAGYPGDPNDYQWNDGGMVNPSTQTYIPQTPGFQPNYQPLGVNPNIGFRNSVNSGFQPPNMTPSFANNPHYYGRSIPQPRYVPPAGITNFAFQGGNFGQGIQQGFGIPRYNYQSPNFINYLNLNPQRAFGYLRGVQSNG